MQNASSTQEDKREESVTTHSAATKQDVESVAILSQRSWTLKLAKNRFSIHLSKDDNHAAFQPKSGWTFCSSYACACTFFTSTKASKLKLSKHSLVPSDRRMVSSPPHPMARSNRRENFWYYWRGRLENELASFSLYAQKVEENITNCKRDYRPYRLLVYWMCGMERYLATEICMRPLVSVMEFMLIVVE